MSWNIYAELAWNPRHLWLENIETEESAKRQAETAVRHNRGTVLRAWVEPAGAEEQGAFHDAVRDMRAAKEREIADWFQDFCKPLTR